MIMTADGKKIYEDFGEMLFTHFGISGPVGLSASSYIGRYQGKELKFIIDLKPALNKEQLDHRVLKDFNKTLNKDFVNSLDHLLPKKLIPVMIELSGIPEHKKVNEITKKERERFVSLLKHLELTITGVRGFKEAIITQGGVNVKEIDPGTMESKKIKGLYFAGEVLDLDAVTGGFNLQIAWSTGYLAGCLLYTSMVRKRMVSTVMSLMMAAAVLTTVPVTNNVKAADKEITRGDYTCLLYTS